MREMKECFRVFVLHIDRDPDRSGGDSHGGGPRYAEVEVQDGKDSDRRA